MKVISRSKNLDVIRARNQGRFGAAERGSEDIGISYSGADINVYIKVPNCPLLKFGNAQTISYSTFRDLRPVKALGRLAVKGYTKGDRTISGTMIFTVIHEHTLKALLDQGTQQISTGAKYNDTDVDLVSTLMVDQIPPFDMVLIFTNEAGDRSFMNIYGIQIFAEGGTFSVQDMLTEQSFQYFARDLDPMSTAEREILDGGHSKEKTATDLLRERDALEQQKKRNPFL